MLNKLLPLFLLFILIACSDTSKNEKSFASLLESKFAIDCKDFNKIYALNEKGYCLKCSYKFMRFLEEEQFKDSTLIFFSGLGSKVDYSSFISSTNPNVIYDTNEVIDTYFKINSPAVFILKNCAVDSTVLITPETVNLVVK